MIRSSNLSLFGTNLKFKYAFTKLVYALSTSSCIAFSFANTLFPVSNAAANAVHVAGVYSFSTIFSTFAMNERNAALSPLMKSSI